MLLHFARWFFPKLGCYWVDTKLLLIHAGGHQRKGELDAALLLPNLGGGRVAARSCVCVFLLLGVLA